MNMISRDERKGQKGIKKFINSFKYPISGIRYAYRNEQNLAFDIGIALLVIICGFLFKLSGSEWATIILTIGLVISCELTNTAIEAVVDLVTEEYHPLAKVAKDTAAAAVFVFAVIAVIVGLIIFLPKVIALF